MKKKIHRIFLLPRKPDSSSAVKEAKEALKKSVDALTDAVTELQEEMIKLNVFTALREDIRRLKIG